jgi:hypothetical protein
MRYGTGFAFLMAMLLSSSPVVKAEAYYYCDYYAECGGWDGDYCYDWWYDWDCGWYDDGGGGDPGGGGGSPEIPYAVELTESGH